jgi:dTDP-4-amino-4,6-dideoxygalactose transaminase
VPFAFRHRVQNFAMLIIGNMLMSADGLKTGWNRDRIVAEVTAAGVPLFQGSCSEVYLEKAFDGTGFRPAARLPVARELGETSLMFLVHPTLLDDEVNKMCRTVAEIVSNAAR